MAIIKHIEDIQAVVGVYSDLQFDQIKVFVEEVEEEEILPLLGEEFYNSLSDKDMYEGVEAELVKRIGRPVITLAFLAAIPELNVGMSAQGLVVSKTESVVPASEVRVMKLERSLLNNGHKRINALIRYLEKNKGEQAFSAMELPTQAEKTSYFLKNTEEFNEVVFIEKNHYVFLKLVPLMREVEMQVIESVLGDAFYTTVIDSFKSQEGLAEAYKPLLIYVRKLLAYQTMADGIIDFGIKMDKNGITIFNSNYAETVNVRKPVEDAELVRFQRKHQDKASEWLKLLIAFLNGKANEADYADFKQSEYYEEEEATEESSGSASPISGDGYVGF